MIFFLVFVILHYLVPEFAVDPEGTLEPQAAPHTGDSAAERAAHGEQPPPGLRERLQTGLTERVSTVEQARDALQTGVRHEAHATFGILA